MSTGFKLRERVFNVAGKPSTQPKPHITVETNLHPPIDLENGQLSQSAMLLMQIKQHIIFLLNILANPDLPN